jgi:hypothetical protein
MKNLVGNKERLFEASREGDLVLSHIYISKKPNILSLIKAKGVSVVIPRWVR